jgi:uncharacterized protein (TIGR00251 family)
MGVGVFSAADLVASHADGSCLSVWVVPGARRTEIAGTHAGCLRVRVAAPPEKGRANRAVEELLASELGSRVRLISGANSRRKRFSVPGVAEADLVLRLETILG